MKKALLLLFAICLLVGSVSAADGAKNLQKIYAVDSDVYEALTYLYLDQGYSLPSTTGPWSADELLKMLDKINPAALKSGAVTTYDFVLGELDQKRKAVKFGLTTSAEAYYHTNTTDFTGEGDWIRGFDERNPVLDIVLETWPSEHFYGYSSLPVQNNLHNGASATEGATSTLWGENALTTNIPLVPPAVIADLNMNVPYRAFGSIGGDGWSAQIGRDKLSWGPGESGNFVLGDHIRYHNTGRLTTYSKNFKYTFATSFFPYPEAYYPIIDNSGNFINEGSQDTILDGINMFIGHRLEGRLFNNKLGLVLTEAIMYQSKENALDLSVLSPAAIFHNYYIRSNANSIISIEADYSPFKHVDLYGQVVVDEFYLPGEPVPGVNASALPNAFGYMAGVKTSYPLGKGMLFGSAEWAKTDPYLYLRDKGDRNQEQGDYGINWIIALREFNATSGISYTEDFIGYQYGGDAIVYNANAGYKQFGKWSVEGNFFFMIHGTHDKWTTWGNQDDSAQDTETTPTTTHNTANNGDLNAQTERDIASRTMVAGVRGGYTILKGLEAYAQADYIYIQYPGNISSAAPISDIQLTVGCTYSF